MSNSQQYYEGYSHGRSNGATQTGGGQYSNEAINTSQDAYSAYHHQPESTNTNYSYHNNGTGDQDGQQQYYGSPYNHYSDTLNANNSNNSYYHHPNGSSDHHRTSSYGSNDGGAYNNTQLYPPAPPQSFQPAPPTPMPSRTSYAPYYSSSYDVSSVSQNPHPSSLPMPQASVSSSLSMPQPANYSVQSVEPPVSHVYPPPDYQVHRTTPPESPGAQFTHVNDHQHYHPTQNNATTAGTTGTAGTAPPPPTVPAHSSPYPPVGYSRPPSQDYISTFRPSQIQQTTSTISTPSSDTSYTPPLGHQRTPSSMRNIIHNTIERPRYTTTRTTLIDTTQDGQNEEIPFIPVSPDTSDDEDHSPTPIERQQLYERQQAALQRQLDRQRLLEERQQGPPPAAPAHNVVVEPSILQSNTQFHHIKVQPQQPQQQQLEDRKNAPLPPPPPPPTSRSRPTSMTPDMDCSLLSDLSRAFIKRIKALEHVRELFCANEYPESFTGSEAVTALHKILGEKVPESYCIKVANALMHSRPGLFDPVHYSQKSLITGTVYNSPDELYTFDEDAGEDDVPHGVFTSLTKCYTYGCHTDQGGCYAPRCPNKQEVFEAEFLSEQSLSRQASVKSNMSTNAKTSHPHTAWAERAPPELLASISKRERDRQEAINEMIYSEEVYLNDLDTLHDLVVIPLLESNIIDGRKRKQFVKEVFNNYYELRDISTALFKDLLELQRRYDQKCVPMIGDIMVQHFPFFEKPFTTYCPHVPLAEYIVAMESQENPEFSRFLAEVAKHQRMRRLAFRHFLLNPVTRMQRYKLLLSAVLKKTDEDHADYTYLNRCIEMIGQVAGKADAQTAATEKRVEILQIDDALVFKQGEAYELQLADIHRKLYHRGELKRKPTNVDVSEKSDIHAFVFDHVFLMTKHRKTSTGDEYRVWKRPIPLQMLFIQGAADYAGGGSTSRVPSMTGSVNGYTGSLVSGGGGGSATAPGAISLTLYHLGQRGGAYTFFCSTMDEKQQWIKAIEDAKATLKRRQGDNDVFELRTLDDSSFRFVSSTTTSGGQGKVTCSVPFVTIDREYKVAIGTDAGVYFKTVNQNNLRRVINCENVTQLAVMDKHHILLVLADKTLKAYPVDALNSPTNIRSPERLAQELAQHVSFFHVGFCNNRDLLVYKKKKNTSSTFSALEPICDLRDPRNERLLTQRTGFLGQRSNTSWFRKYMDFYVGADATNLHFLKSKVNVVCERGFEIIDPENLSVARDIPDQEDPQFNFVQRQTEPLKPLAMYRIQDKFLLCYNKFAFYVNNRNGSLVIRGSGRSPLLCEWEGNPDHIVYQHPYIVAVSSQFIEVRHVDTGELVQIIPGDNIRLTYYNGGGDMPIIHGCMTHSQKPDTQHVFNLWLDPERTNNSGNSSRRHVFS